MCHRIGNPLAICLFRMENRSTGNNFSDFDPWLEDTSVSVYYQSYDDKRN